MGIIYEGMTLPMHDSYTPQNMRISEQFGITSLKLNGYLCPRCQKSDGYLALDGRHSLYFCGVDQCLFEDCEASKAIARAKRLASEESEKTKAEYQQQQKLVNAFGELYRNAALSNLRLGQSQQNQLEDWLKGDRGFYVFIGRSGCGKTSHCAACYYWMIKNTNKIRYLPVRSLFSQLKEAMGEEENSTSILQEYCKVDVLLLDDLMSLQYSEWQREILFELIDYRYEHQKKTMITSNLKYEDMAKNLGDRIASRVFDKRNKFLEDWSTNYRIMK